MQGWFEQLASGARGLGWRQPLGPRLAPAAPMRIALLAHARHPIAEPFAGGLETHTSVTADALVARGHQVTLFAKAGSVSRAEVVEIVEADLAFGRGLRRRRRRRRPPPRRGVRGGARRRRARRLRRRARQHAEPGTYPARRTADADRAAHARDPRADERRARRPRLGAGPLHRFVAVSAHTQRDWRSRLPEVGRVLNGIDLTRWHPGDRQVDAPHASGRGASRPRRASTSRSTPPGWPAGPADQRSRVRRGLLRRRDRAPARRRRHLRRPPPPDRARAFLAAGSVLLSPALGRAVRPRRGGGDGVPHPGRRAPRRCRRRGGRPPGGVLARRSDAESLAAALLGAVRLDRGRVRTSALRFGAERMVTAYERVLAGLVQGPGARVDELV